jgi:predicted MPP superfamily phosphohydrolase
VPRFALRSIVGSLIRRPFRDELGRKGWLEELARAQPTQMRKLRLVVAGWPRPRRPLRIAFLADFHIGSHAGDVARLHGIVEQVRARKPDLVLFGGDYMNMQPFGGGRVPPEVIATALARLTAPLGCFAVLGNHDVDYGAAEVARCLQDRGIVVLDDQRRELRVDDAVLDLVGIPDCGSQRANARALLAGLSPVRPTLVLAHDPCWFAHLPAGPHLMLCGHTHGGQIRLPGLGALINMSEAPLRLSYGLAVEEGRTLYVTSGIGTSLLPLRIGIPPEFVIIDVTGTRAEHDAH